jgi:outer membrane cobalamin receptor
MGRSTDGRLGGFRVAVLCLLLASGAGACAMHRQASDGGSPEFITEQEVRQSRAANAYEVVARLRGNFLRNRGATSVMNTSSPEPTVYVDGVPMGPPATLRSIPAEQVATIRLYRAWEATTKFGSGNMGGVIDVVTRR